MTLTEQALRVGAALAAPFTDPGSRTFLPSLLAAALVAAVFHVVRHRSTGDSRGGLRGLVDGALAPRSWLHRSAILDVQLLITRQLLSLLGAIPELASAWLLATWLVRTLDGAVGAPTVPQLPLAVISVTYSLVLFVAWDASRYVLHRLMHQVPALWQLHQVHHSAEVLTPLTFHRIHPLESLLYQLRGALVTGVVAGVAFWLYRGGAVEVTLLGVHALGLVLNAATGNLRHSHVWLRFGPAVERWLISPAQHQLHHSLDRADHDCNYGTWLAVWDRLGGSLKIAGERAPLAFGIDPAERNHGPHDLVSALVRPVLAAGGILVGRPRPAVGAAILVSVGLAGEARAEEPAASPVTGDPADEGRAPADDDDPTYDDAAYEVIIETEEGVPRVAGSAHAIGEEELERYEYDDIHKVLSKVPGVYVRGEDGFGLRPNIGIRGGNSDRSAKITLLEDGVPLAPAPYAAPAAYYFPMATRLAGVEVFKGPAATRHGPQTIGGAVNLLTRKVPTGTAGQLDVAAGLRRTVKAHGYTGAGTASRGLLVEGSHLSTGGFKELDDGGPTGFQRQDLMVKGRLGSGVGTERSHIVDLKLGYGRELSHETYLGLTGDDFEESPYRRYAASANDLMRWQRYQAELGWKVRLGERFDVRTVGYYHDLNRAWTKLNRFAGGPNLHDLLQQPDGGQAAVYVGILRGDEDSAGGDQVLMIGTNDRRLRNWGVQTLAHHRVGSGAVQSELEVGVRLHRDHVVRLHTEDPHDMVGGQLVPTGGETLTTLDALTTATALAAHVHDDLQLGKLHLLPGVRVEGIRTGAGTPDDGVDEVETRVIPLPGLGVLGQVAPWLDLFGGVHRGFSPVPPGSGADALPETSWSYEAGLRAVPGETHVELVGYFSDYDNITGQCTLSGGCTDDQLDQQFNGGRAWVYGLESVLGHRFLLPSRMSLGAEGSYTLTLSEFRTGFVSGFPQFGTVVIGDQLPYVPVHQGSLRVVLEHPRASLAVAGNGRSALRDEAGQGPIPEEQDIPGIVLVDVAGELALTDRVRAYATATNVTNTVAIESWRPFGARPVAPMQLMVGVKASL